MSFPQCVEKFVEKVWLIILLSLAEGIPERKESVGQKTQKNQPTQYRKCFFRSLSKRSRNIFQHVEYSGEYMCGKARIIPKKLIKNKEY